MRATSLALALALLAACGSSKKAEAPALNGGLTGAGPSGTVEGQAFAAADGGALTVAPAFCSALSTNVGGLVVAFSSYPSFCPFKRGANACGDHPSSAELIVTLARGGPTPPPAVGPGTYPIGTNPSALTATSVDLRRLGATCADLTTYQSVSGSVTLDQVSPTVKGSLSATFWSGSAANGTNLGTISGTFEVGSCTLPFDLCGLIAGTTCPTPACIP